MIKQLLIISTFLLLTSCGQKSVIKSDVMSRTTAEAYGDGTFVIRPLFMPLSDQAISSFDSPVERVDFIAGGFARMFMNLGAGMGLGRTQLTLIQPVPSVPTDVIKGAKLKRLFFYIEPKAGQTRWASNVKKLIFGQGSVTFGFLDKLAMKISSVNQQQFKSWTPEFEAKSLKRKDFTPLQALFEEADIYNEVLDPYQEKSLVILKYDRDQKQKFLKNNKYGLTYIVHAKHPAKTKKYLLKEPQFQGFFKQIHMLNETLVIELEKDPVVEEAFKVILSEDTNLIDKFKIDLVEQCTELTCLDMEVPDVDILPMIARGNALKIDAYINADKAPESFQLKGFVEFEIKLKLTF